MRLLIFGSTRGTGRELLGQALDEGHQVTAFARDPASLHGYGSAGLEVFPGDVLDPMAVQRAVENREVVCCTIGAGAGRTTLREEGTRNIVAAMERAGVRRLVCQSTLGLGDSRANLGFFTRFVVVPIFLRHAFADHARQEEVVRSSSLSWTLVRPPHLKDGPRTGTYRHGFPPADRSIAGKISRADVADFMLRQLSDDTYLRRAPGVSY